MKPKESNKDAKVSQGTSPNAPWGTGAVNMRTSIQKENIHWHDMGTVFDKIDKNIIKNYHRHFSENTLKLMPKWCQYADKIDAQSDPKLISKQI